MSELNYEDLDDHVFEEINLDQLLGLIESHVPVPVFFAFEACDWCQEYIHYLNDAAKENDISKIYYFNPREIRNVSFDEKLDQFVLNEYFQKIVTALGNKNVSRKNVCDIDNVKKICDNKEMTEKYVSWIYVPTLYIFQDGFVLGSYEGPIDHIRVDGVLPRMTPKQEMELMCNYRALLALI